MPLLSKGRPIGIVILSHSSRPRKWDEDAQRLLGQLMLEGSLVVENAALRAVEHDRIDELSEQAFHDSLTGLPNRALFANRLEHAFARMNRRKGSVAVLFLDLDGFKDDQRQLRARGRRPAADRGQPPPAGLACARRTRSRAWAATSSRC